jgi:hypothetical protein
MSLRFSLPNYRWCRWLVLGSVVCVGVIAGNMIAPAHAETLERALEAYEFEEYQSAAQWLRPWAEKGHAEAQYRLGNLYEHGRGVEPSLSEAKKWYGRAAGQGHVVARRRLEALEGRMASAGGESVALKWYQDKAAEGDPDAQYNLGFMYETGFSVPKDYGRAAQWYETAANKKNVPAQLRLGLMYLAGIGVKQSEIQGERWLGAAAEANNKLAAGVRQMLLNANPELALDKTQMAERLRVASLKDEQKALALLTSAVQEATAQFERERAQREAQMAKRRGIQSAMEQETDVEFGLDAQGHRTIAWYKYNAERGVSLAQFELGKRYELGLDVAMDMREAVRWYEAAAEQGFPDAQYYLAMLHLYGIGVEKNEALAQSLITAAAGQGHAGARRTLDQMKSGQAPAQNSMAVWWLTRYGQDANGKALQHVGALYQQGRGVPLDQAEGLKYVQKSIALGLNASQQPSLPSTERVAAPRQAESREEVAPDVNSARPAQPEASTAEHTDSGEDAPAAGGRWIKILFFVGAALLPVGAFVWFMRQEQRRLAKRSAPPGAQRDATTEPSSGRASRTPPNPFR